MNTSDRPRNLLLYEVAASDAWPLMGVKDFDEFNSRLLSGEPVRGAADDRRSGAPAAAAGQAAGIDLRNPSPREEILFHPRSLNCVWRRAAPRDALASDDNEQTMQNGGNDDGDPAKTTRSRLRVILAASIGSALEWYDFFLYGTAAALVFGELFFPKSDPVVGTLLAFLTFGVGFVVRPLGGILFGIMGDRFGRKPVLVATLLMIGVGTTLIGCCRPMRMIGYLGADPAGRDARGAGFGRRR